MRGLAAIAALLLWAAPVAAQSPHPPRVQVILERGPLPVGVLQRAWPGRDFRRCQEEGTDDIVHLHVRIDPDASVVVEHGLIDGEIRGSERCVVEVLTAARFPVQTEPTHAAVTIWFVPPMARDVRASSSARDPDPLVSRGLSINRNGRAGSQHPPDRDPPARSAGVGRGAPGAARRGASPKVRSTVGLGMGGGAQPPPETQSPASKRATKARPSASY